MKISWHTLQRFFDKDLPRADKLEAIFTFGAFEVEGMEKYSGKNIAQGDGRGDDSVIDLKVLPDRACYALSWQGIAYELSALTGIALANKPFDLGKAADGKVVEVPIPVALYPEAKHKHAVKRADRESGRQVDREVIVKVDDNADCNRQMAQFIHGIDWRPAPAWLAAELDKVGQRSISAIVDITNYVMLFAGQPLHAFDADKVRGPIRIRKATNGETVTLLDGSIKTLDETITVIADDVGPLDVAGVKGGKRAEVGADTNKIIMVASSFDPVSIRKASNKIGIKNDASKRFENNISPKMSRIGMEYVSYLIAEIFGDSKFGPVTDVVVKTEPELVPVVVNLDSINTVLGSNLGVKQATAPLEALYFEVEQAGGAGGVGGFGHGDVFTITPPFWRRDIAIPEDIYEEVGRVIGYDKIPSTLPPPVKLDRVNPQFYVTEWIKNILVAKGYSEVMLYTLGSEGYYETLYPVASDKAFLRSNLTKNMKTCLENNTKHADYLGLDDIMIFEIGKIFTEPGNKSDEELVDDGERLHLSIAVSLSKQTKKRTGQSPADLIIKTLADLGTAIGHELQGQVSSKDMLAWAEVSLDAAVSAMAQSKKVPTNYSALNLGRAVDISYNKISPYPYAIRDVAFFVAGATDDKLQDELASMIRKHAGANLVALRLFDVFTKIDEVKATNEAGVTTTTKNSKTSYAYRLIFQSQEKTLSDGEITGAMDAVYGALKAKGYEIR